MRNDNNVGNDLKAVAQDVMQLGARCVQAGREWLADRRNEMTNRNEGHRHAQREPDRSQWEREQPENQRHGLGGSAYSPGSQGFGGYAGGQHGHGYGSSSGYGGPGRQRSYVGVGPRNYSRSDERITEDLCERLTHDPDIDASDIEVQVVNGTATLEGTVGHRWMKHRAEDLADGCSGVRNVENRIRVQSTRPGYDSGAYAASDWSTSSGRGSASSTSSAGRSTAATGTSGTGTSGTSSVAGTGSTASGKPGGTPSGSSTPH